MRSPCREAGGFFIYGDIYGNFYEIGLVFVGTKKYGLY